MHQIYAVPQSHYDVVWAFTEEEYLQINEIIVQNAVDLIEQGGFKFSIEQTFLLEQLEKRNPKLWEKLRQLIVEDKFGIIDGWYMMSDQMLPKGEALVRCIMRGKRYASDKFGIQVPVAWVADSFGMNAQMPQIYNLSGYKWLAFRRGARHEIQQSEFIWKGLDGSSIMAHWMPFGYRAGLYIEDWPETFQELKRWAASPNVMMPCGSGSTPPQPEMPAAVEVWNQNHPEAPMRVTSPAEFFEALEPYRETLSTIEGELYDDDLADVFPQVCSTRTWIIQQYRECERLIMQAEGWAAIAWLLGARYPKRELYDAWEKVLYTTFHDVIAGCGADEIYVDVKQMLANLRMTLDVVLKQQLECITKQIDAPPTSRAVFNLLPWPVDHGAPAGEILQAGAALPPTGYRVTPNTATDATDEHGITVTGNRVETPFWDLEIDETSGLIQVWDKQGEPLFSGNEIVIEDEVGDLYHHRSRYSPELINSESGQGFQFGSFKPKGLRFERDGVSLKIVYETEYYCLTWPYRLKDKFPIVIYKYKSLDIRKEVIVTAGSPRLEFKTWIDNNYPNVRVKVRFDSGIDRNIYHRETQFGVIPEVSQYHYKGKPDQPTGIPTFLTWFDLSDGDRGITFMNKGTPSVDIAGGVVDATLFRSVSGISADGTAGPLVPTPDALELTEHNFEYALEPHAGDWQQAKVYRSALEYQNPPVAATCPGGGDLPPELSFFKFSVDNLIISALKKAEDSDAVILRCYETHGEATPTELTAFRDFKRVTEVDLLENETAELKHQGNACRIEVAPWEIKSLKLEL
jgi:alpha-mannosidase